jgi:hypothetical protein
MKVLSEDANSRMDFTYHDATKKFKFIFPPNLYIVKSMVLLPTKLAGRLGFGLANSINQNSAEGECIDDKIDVTKTEIRARALG